MIATKNPRNDKIIAQFGVNVCKCLNNRDMTMVELAGVEYGTISTIERGLVNCTISTAYEISKALGVTIDKLFE